MDIIWYDGEALNGRGIPGKNVDEVDINLGPANKREIPCGACPRKSVCGVESVECEAFRVWCNKGNYEDFLVGIKLKAI